MRAKPWRALLAGLSLALLGCPARGGATGQASYVASAGAGGVGPAALGPTPPAPAEATPPVEQRRRFSRSVQVTRVGQPFSLITRYGRVRVSAWDKPEIKVEAELLARAETPAAAAQLLAGLGVQWLAYDARTGGVAVSSQFKPGLRGKGGAGCRYEINYTVWLPATTALRLQTAFADVVVAGDWLGPAQLDVSYGTLRTARLAGTGNVVRIANGDATLPYARQATLQANYAKLRLDAAGQLELSTNYSAVDLGTVRDLTVHSKYGGVALGSVRTLRGSSGYSHFSVDKLSEDLDMTVRYCSDFEVRNLEASFRQVTLAGDYSTIRLGFAGPAPSFRFAVRTEQGQLLVDKSQVRVLSTGGQADGIADVVGVYGGGPPARGAGSVSIKVRYGTVRFSK